MGSPICKMLAAEGVDAIDPLLDVLDHDQRLTRSYSFGRNFFPARHLITVSEAAEALLVEFYKISPFRWKDPAERRAWLVRNKNRSEAERAFDLLADDKNEEIQWLDGARILLAPNSNGRSLVGDTLRSLTNPSVSEVLAKRATQMQTNWADDVGLFLYQWDPPAALDTLHRLAIRDRSYKGQLYGSIVAALLQLGDRSAVGDWATAVETDHSIYQLVSVRIALG